MYNATELREAPRKGEIESTGTNLDESWDRGDLKGDEPLRCLLICYGDLEESFEAFLAVLETEEYPSAHLLERVELLESRDEYIPYWVALFFREPSEPSVRSWLRGKFASLPAGVLGSSSPKALKSAAHPMVRESA
jgi:hypothetical protein